MLFLTRDKHYTRKGRCSHFKHLWYRRIKGTIHSVQVIFFREKYKGSNRTYVVLTTPCQTLIPRAHRLTHSDRVKVRIAGTLWQSSNCAEIEMGARPSPPVYFSYEQRLSQNVIDCFSHPENSTNSKQSLIFDFMAIPKCLFCLFVGLIVFRLLSFSLQLTLRPCCPPVSGCKNWTGNWKKKIGGCGLDLMIFFSLLCISLCRRCESCFALVFDERGSSSCGGCMSQICTICFDLYMNMCLMRWALLLFQLHLLSMTMFLQQLSPYNFSCTVTFALTLRAR